MFTFAVNLGLHLSHSLRARCPHRLLFLLTVSRASAATDRKRGHLVTSTLNPAVCSVQPTLKGRGSLCLLSAPDVTLWIAESPFRETSLGTEQWPAVRHSCQQRNRKGAGPRGHEEGSFREPWVT